ncbi:MAG TPA: hypothetical protein VGW40_03115 [Allosphingosinicella sp.]|nr:hypothetical protein [Allosphingosinicella sp.]
MVVMIVLIVMAASVLRAGFGHRRRHRGEDRAIRDDAETQRLREEVKQLKERLAVIERITVEKENSLEREIERLRDH